MTGERVVIQLTQDEALVLFEWLDVLNQRDDISFVDQAEQRVLWDIQAALEGALVQPLAGDYIIQVAEARDRVRDA